MTWSKLNGHSPNRSARSFEDELEAVIDGGEFANYPIYTIDGIIAVDEVIPYEFGWERIRELGVKHGKKVPEDTPRAKGNFRLDRRPANEILSDAQKEAVYKKTRLEFDLFGFVR